MVDRVRPLKLESPGTGGTETDLFPTGINNQEDYIDCRGVTIQNDSSDDEIVYISRNVDNLIFKDSANPEKTLSDLAASSSGITADAHKILRQLIHFIDDGPAEGFTSGAYKETTGTVFPTAEVWYVDSGKTDKIVELLTTWSGTSITQEKWKIYDTDGSTVLWTITDAIYYSGIFEASRTRTITAGDA